MLEQLKTDRVSQLLFIAVAFVAVLICCGIVRSVIFVLIRPTEQIIQPPTPTPVVLQFKGEGDDVILFDATESGPALFGLMHRGEKNFIVELMYSDGTLIDLLVNEAGEYNGKKAIHLEKGSYILQIQADGPWAIVILPPQ